MKCIWAKGKGLRTEMQVFLYDIKMFGNSKNLLLQIIYIPLLMCLNENV